MYVPNVNIELVSSKLALSDGPYLQGWAKKIPKPRKCRPLLIMLENIIIFTIFVYFRPTTYRPQNIMLMMFLWPFVTYRQNVPISQIRASGMCVGELLHILLCMGGGSTIVLLARRAQEATSINSLDTLAARSIPLCALHTASHCGTTKIRAPPLHFIPTAMHAD